MEFSDWVRVKKKTKHYTLSSAMVSQIWPSARKKVDGTKSTDNYYSDSLFFLLLFEILGWKGPSTPFSRKETKNLKILICNNLFSRRW